MKYLRETPGLNSVLIMSMGFMLLGLCPGTNAQANFAGQSKLGRVRGVLLDVIEARIVDATVTIEGNGLKNEVTVNDRGEYEFQIPPGIYSLRSRASNYYESRRAPVRVRAGKEIVVNIAPTLRILGMWYELKEEGSGERVQIASPPQYETFGQPATTDPELTLLVQYKKKQVEKDSTDYQEGVVSYDTLTVQGNTLRIPNNSTKIKVVGNVTIDIGGQRIHTDLAEIDLKSRTVSFSVSF
jgi:hypothetical protein